MENNFNGFMVFLSFIFTILFCLTGVGFVVSFICSLIIVVFIRAMYILYRFILKILGGVSFGKNTNKREV